MGLTRAEQKVRGAVFELNGDRCMICRIARPASYSHRLPRSAGGGFTVVNGLALCGDGVSGCHGALEARPDLAYACGWKVRRGHDPDTTAVLAEIDLRIGWWQPLHGDDAWELRDDRPRYGFRHDLEMAHWLLHAPGDVYARAAEYLPDRVIPKGMWPPRAVSPVSGWRR